MSGRHAINRGDERDLYLEGLAEQIHITRDELAVMEAEYERVRRAPVDFDPDPSTRERPGIDPRLFDLGTDRSEEWRVPEERLPRHIESVQVGDRL